MTSIGKILIFALSGLMFMPLFSYGQLILLDVPCSSCQEIPDRETLEFLKNEFPLVIWTSPSIYDHNSIITVNGHSNLGDEFPVIVVVTDPSGQLITTKQLAPDENGDFSVEFDTSTKPWDDDGSYFILGQLGVGGESKDFRIKVLVLQEVGNATPINYWIEGGEVLEVIPEFTSKSMIVKLTATEDGGMLNAYLPRDIIDAKVATKELMGAPGGSLIQYNIQDDDEFTILVDGKNISKVEANVAKAEFPITIPIGYYDEKKILDTRILKIPFSPNVQTIEIIGNQFPIQAISNGKITETVTSADGSITVKINSGMPEADQVLPIEIQFIDSQSDSLIPHINYDVAVFQGESNLLEEKDLYESGGIGRHVTQPLTTSEHVDIEVTLQGIGQKPPLYGPQGEILGVTVVPEFGQIVFLILIVSISALIATRFNHFLKF